jgi:hypothetical protein
LWIGGFYTSHPPFAVAEQAGLSRKESFLVGRRLSGWHDDWKAKNC